MLILNTGLVKPGVKCQGGGGVILSQWRKTLAGGSFASRRWPFHKLQPQRPAGSKNKYGCICYFAFTIVWVDRYMSCKWHPHY